MNDLTAGWIRDGDKKQYTQSIDSLRKKIQGIQDALLSGKSVQASLFELYSEMDRLNTNTGRFSPPINVNDLRKALTIVQAPGGLSMDQRRAEILNTLSSVFNKSLTA